MTCEDGEDHKHPLCPVTVVRTRVVSGGDRWEIVVVIREWWRQGGGGGGGGGGDGDGGGTFLVPRTSARETFL